MIEKSDDRIWVKSRVSDRYYLLGKGFTSLREICKPVILETPNLFSPLCKREIVGQTGQLEFEGYRRFDQAQDLLLSCYFRRGTDAQITFIIANRQDAYGEAFIPARRIIGQVCIENKGTGEGVLGGKFKGRILYTTAPEKGTFDEQTHLFF